MRTSEGAKTTTVRIFRFGILGIVIGLAVVSVGWAAVQLFGNREALVASDSFALVSVDRGSVGQSIGLSVTAQWTSRVVANNSAAGVVTTVDARQGATVKLGDRLYSANLRPTIVAIGRVPSFRPLEVGVSGPDVTQLQRMLTSLGFLVGGTDGVFGSGTKVAVMEWQHSLGVERTGSVEVGDIAFVPRLPMRVFLDDSIVSVGKVIVGGEPAISALSSTPSFQLPVTGAQDLLIGKRTKIVVRAPGGFHWHAVVVDRQNGENGGLLLTLAGPNGQPVCRLRCNDIPVVGQTLLPSEVIVVPTTRGSILPSAAIFSRADGSLVVTLANGTQHEVTIQAEALGMIVVNGLDDGTEVRVPATEN